jgi:uncharacterized membrane protein
MTAGRPGKSRLIGFLSTIFTAGFPAFIYLAYDVVSPSVIALVGVGLLLARLATVSRDAEPVVFFGLTGGIVLFAVAIATGDKTMALMYPTLVNASLMLLFAVTLWRPPSLAERLARMRGMEVSPEGVAYTRWVTALWALFFLFNGSIAAVLAIRGDIAIWAFYTGVLGYVMAGTLMAAELVFRRFYKARIARQARDADCMPQ